MSNEWHKKTTSQALIIHILCAGLKGHKQVYIWAALISRSRIKKMFLNTDFSSIISFLRNIINSVFCVLKYPEKCFCRNSKKCFMHTYTQIQKYVAVCCKQYRAEPLEADPVPIPISPVPPGLDPTSPMQWSWRGGREGRVWGRDWGDRRSGTRGGLSYVWHLSKRKQSKKNKQKEPRLCFVSLSNLSGRE